MNKIRVYELAKELNVSNKEIISALSDMGISAKNHMSAILEEDAEKVKNHFKKNSSNEKSTIKPNDEITYDRGNDMIEKKDEQVGDVESIDDKYEIFVDENKRKPKKDDEAAANKKFKSKQKTKPHFEKDKFAGKKENNTDDNAKAITKVIIPEQLTVKELAAKLQKPTGEIIKKLILVGVMATLNQELDFDLASLVIQEYGIEVEKERSKDPEDILKYEEPEDPSKLATRPPVVVVMGHVDHGKTSLLDAIRHANVISSEAGGITQHIGAYRVNINGKKITFLDTPGHEAFTAMRARGAQATDIAVLVVAADDGIMPQTVEAINHAKAANLSLIVAINKIDKPGADVDKVKQELTEYGLVAEEWGGDTVCVPVSAKSRVGIENLLEMITLVADMMELKANPSCPARGTVIEAKLDKGKGPVATLLVQKGTLNVGDIVLAGTSVGRVRAMTDDKGKQVKKARPSTPVEVVGLSEVPESGDIFYCLDDEKFARNVAETRKQKAKEELFQARQTITLENLFSSIEEGKTKELNVIVKADVHGSFEAIRQSIEKLTNEEVRVKIIHGGAGAITESDVMLASASNALIIGFNVRPEQNVSVLAERSSVEIKLYRVIYDALNDLEAAMKGMLDPEYKEVVLGHAEVRNLFKVSSVGTICGSYILDGKITRNAKVRLLRENIVIYEGEIDTLKRFKDDAKEVASGFECGILLNKYNDVKEGDIIEAFVMEAIPRK